MHTGEIYNTFPILHEDYTVGIVSAVIVTPGAGISVGISIGSISVSIEGAATYSLPSVYMIVVSIFIEGKKINHQFLHILPTLL